MRFYIPFLMLGLAACSILPDSPPVPVYTLQGHYASSVQGEAPLVVERPKAVGRLSTRHMVIHESSGRQNSVANAQWTDSLPKLLQNQMIMALSQTGYVAARPDAGIISDGILQTELHDFSWHDAEGEVVISVTARLVEAHSRRVMASQTFHVKKAMNDASVERLVMTFNEGLSELGDRLVTWVHQEMGTSK